MIPIAVLYVLLMTSTAYPPLLLVAGPLAIVYVRHIRRRMRRIRADHAQAASRRQRTEIAKAVRVFA